MPVNGRKMLFLDLETTGLEPGHHEIIEAAWRLTSPDGETTLLEYSSKVLPEHIERAEPEALQINGYNAVEWAPEACITQAQLATLVWQVSKNVVLAGHGVNFDEGFLVALLSAHRMKKGWHYQTADTQKLAWPLYMTGRIPSVGLKHVAKFFGYEQPDPHRALVDVDLSHKVFLRLIEAYTKSLDTK